MNSRFNYHLLSAVAMLGALSSTAAVWAQPAPAQIIKGDAARALARQMGLTVRAKRPNGRVIELVCFVDGQPVYRTTNNWRAAQTVSTDSARFAVSSLVLDGSGVLMGLWDSGYPRVTHQEFGGRITHGGDAALVYDDHACHAAGTMIAAGVNSMAQGMAPNGTLTAFEWNNDAQEMNSQTLPISNHSYGGIAGWDFDGYNANEWTWANGGTSSFGHYNYIDADETSARRVDEIAYAKPGFLVVNAAGNDRGEGPTPGTPHNHWNGFGWTWGHTDTHPLDGPYDCIATWGVAKNILTVGSVEDINGGWGQPSDVVMSSYSSWGPTNDGRIKPDIVANGVDLFSTTTGADNDYDVMDGTSMASPSAAGSAAVLLYYWYQLHTDPDNMPATRSATLKGLIIHTAREAGPNEGPDYSFGWGLMDTLNACVAIKCDRYLPDTIQELQLDAAPNHEYGRKMPGVRVGDKVKVTLCWTDPHHAAIPAGDTTTRALVNDLDLRVIHDGTATTYYPWTLNPAIPSAAAVRNADNDRDNVEVVEFTAVHAGSYTVRVTHKGTLTNGSQKFSLFVNGWYKDIGSIPPGLLFSVINNPVVAHHALMLAGTYAENGTISQPVTLYSANGTVTIGD